MDMFLYFYHVWSLMEAPLTLWLNVKYGYVHKQLGYEKEWQPHSYIL